MSTKMIKRVHELAGVPVPRKRLSLPSDPVARRQTIERAQRLAVNLESAAEAARIATLSPYERAAELANEAARARYEADELAAEARRAAAETAQPTTLDEAVRIAETLAPADPATKAELAKVKRELALTKLQPMALRMGVDFDLDAALKSGISVQAARDQVFDAAADASDALVIKNRSTSHTAQQANAGAGWDQSLKNVAARHGLTIAG